MTIETLTLQLEFKNAEKKTRQLNLEHTKPDLAPELVQQAMNQIATSHLIDKKGVDAYQSPQAARYIRRTVSDVFAATKD
jgi:uncharacterized protein YpiB (UPF0302 family)